MQFGGRMAKVEVKHREVSFENMMAELINISNKEDTTYKSEFLRLRLEIVKIALENN